MAGSPVTGAADGGWLGWTLAQERTQARGHAQEHRDTGTQGHSNTGRAHGHMPKIKKQVADADGMMSCLV